MKKAFYLLFTKDYLNSKQRYERAELYAKVWTMTAGFCLVFVLFMMILGSV